MGFSFDLQIFGEMQTLGNLIEIMERLNTIAINTGARYASMSTTWNSAKLTYNNEAACNTALKQLVESAVHIKQVSNYSSQHEIHIEI